MPHDIYTASALFKSTVRRHFSHPDIKRQGVIIMQNIRIYKEKDYNGVSRRAANLISAQIISKPDCVLGLATGTSPIGTYDQLVEWYKKGDLDFSQVMTVNLDEYVGMSPDNEQSYHYFMKKNLFSRVNIDLKNTHVPDGAASDLKKACSDYDAYIRLIGGVDLQLLGIGQNGHIGFNEPGKSFILDTHVIDLTENTIKANARLFKDEKDVPHQAVTMGIRNIMQAHHIVLVANGENKADALRKTILEDVTPEVPASILQLHPDISIVADEAALSKVPDNICIKIRA